MLRIDLLFIRRPAQICELYLARKPRFPLLLLIIPIAAPLYFGFLYVDHLIMSSKASIATDTMTATERMQWSDFHEAIDDTLQATTVEGALRSLDHLRYRVGYLPYKDERHQSDAYACLDTAERHLSECQVSKKVDPIFWRTALEDAVLSIPKYAGRLEINDSPPPSLVDEASIQYSGT